MKRRNFFRWVGSLLFAPCAIWMARRKANASQPQGDTPEPDTKRIGAVCGFVLSGTSTLLVACEDWQPVYGDMFLLKGTHSVNPRTGRSTGFDFQLVVTQCFDPSENAPKHLKMLMVQPSMLDSGPYRNVDSLPTDGAEIYQPAGAMLRAIQERWLETNR